MSAQPAETTIETTESASTVLQPITNFTTDFVFQFRPAELDNGLTIREFATKSTQDATLSTHRTANVPAACKDTTS